MSTYATTALGFKPAELIEARQRLGITQGEAAQDIDVNVATLRKWEKGERVPTGDYAARVARWIERSKTGPRRDMPITAEEIRTLRDRLGQTQAEFAAVLGVADFTVVSRWENGHVTPERATRERLRRMIAKATEEDRRAAGLPDPASMPRSKPIKAKGKPVAG